MPVWTVADDSLEYIFIIFQTQQELMFHVNPLLSRGFTLNIKQGKKKKDLIFYVNPLLGRGFYMKHQALFSLKDKSKKKIKVLSAAIFI